ncbi:COG5377 Phage-related protein, predicted endonuclease [uncultured Caudovirales phage]|uniref:COG5377 Phage-related protein, predicted endonuclease n=1 Tax=uncultured Caudovirales phage TaxID=2100421 RepID=A0A6J5LPV2_9CAUD|nr:COG5377 Phage-related protein, predicted endonuclease [uncultured Caudovirales phage]
MAREVIAHATEAEWLEARKKDVTSTEAAALFNSGSYIKTFYELYNLKAGIVQPDEFKDNDRTKWGNRLESAIAYGVAEDLGLVVIPFKVYMRDPDARMGSSFDFRIIGLADGFDGDETYRELFRAHGEGILECKNIDSLQFKRNWIDGDSVEATPQIEFQVAHQLEVADLGWAVIAPLVGGNTIKPAYRLRDRAVGKAIRDKCIDLWQRVHALAAPEPDYKQDGDTIAKVYRDNDGASVDMSDNERLAVLCRTYKKASADIKEATEAKDAAKAEILTIIQTAKSIAYEGGKISAGTNKASFRAYYRSPSEKLTITLTPIDGADIEAEAPAFRNVRITEAA